MTRFVFWSAAELYLSATIDRSGGDLRESLAGTLVFIGPALVRNEVGMTLHVDQAGTRVADRIPNDPVFSAVQLVGI